MLIKHEQTTLHICTHVEGTTIYCLCGEVIVETRVWKKNKAAYLDEWVWRLDKNRPTYEQYYEHCKACTDHEDYPLLLLGLIG